MYNHSLSGAVSKTLNSAASNADHIPTIIRRATQQGNAETMVDACPTVTEAAGTSGNNQPIICLNDQGGSVMQVETDGKGGDLIVVDQGAGKSSCSVSLELSPTLATTHGGEPAICGAPENTIGRKVENIGNTSGVVGTCTSAVRRLLPIECERLMGFPDNWTKIPFNGKSADDCPDTPRYKACGNSMCVNVMQWIGEQIDRVERSDEKRMMTKTKGILPIILWEAI
jgi:DNA (cytosine-5)-methyltransferase 1